jgi:hypothetical protein
MAEVESSESESSSGLGLDRRDDGVRAPEDREMAERRRQKPAPGCHQAKFNRKVGQGESGDLRMRSDRRRIGSDSEKP